MKTKGKTKREILTEALANGMEAKYSGKKKKWYFHQTYLTKVKA